MKKILVFLIDHFFPVFIFPIRKNKIVVDSFRGNDYSGNCKYIVDKLIELYGETFDIVWLAKNTEKKKCYPPSVRVVKYNSLQSLIELATAKIWIDDFRKKYFPPKKRRQIYLQTWHGFISLKYIEGDTESSLPYEYVKEAIRDGHAIDYMVSGTKKTTELYKNAFWLGKNARILEFGTPRIDAFFNVNSAVIKDVNDYFMLHDSTRILLYAPTFRNTEDYDYSLNFTKLLEEIEKKFGGNWKVMLRLHPNVKGKERSYIEKNPNVIGVSDYDDVQNLIIRAEIVITDYSSLMFDAMMNEKKVFLYFPDLMTYVSEERKFYFKLSELPFSNNTLFEKLLKSIKKFDTRKYEENVKKFKSRIGIFEDGRASERIAKFIKMKAK